MAGTGQAHLRAGAHLRIEDLEVRFRAPDGRTVQAVSGISLDIKEGETLGLVGESGCGKSTTGRSVVRLVRPSGGRIHLRGRDTTDLDDAEFRALRPHVQMVFQDPASSLNPRRRVAEIVGEPLAVWRRGSDAERAARVRAAVAAVGLAPESILDRRPAQLSGGQCQRVSIARALILEPSLLICDEPVSALDVSVQAQILNLLEDMKDRYGLTVLFISHDLAVVKSISDRIAVMYLGKLCEVAAPEALFSHPRHPYTAALLDAIPSGNHARRPHAADAAPHEVPSPISPPSGCRFRTRCPAATDLCRRVEPHVAEAAPGHFVACHHPLSESRQTALP